MKALILGGAVSGRSAASLLRGLGFWIFGYDESTSYSQDWDVDRLETGPWRSEFLDGVDLVVASPGVPGHSPPIANALEHGIPVISELELAARSIDVPVVAVTGTNGKTTVTEMTDLILRASGVVSETGGNIGTPLSALVGLDADVLVVEASSFQLQFIQQFRPETAVLLNVAPDHLDWHGSYDSYLAAKSRIFENMSASGLVIFDADDEGACRAVEPFSGRLAPVSGLRRPEGGSGPDGEQLWVGDTSVDFSSLASTDPSFLTDLAAAGVAALEHGGTPDGVAQVAASFSPGNHRKTVVDVINGVAFVDDSKATNPHAAIAAVRSYESVVLIAGGRNKGLDVGHIGAEPTVRHIIGIGEAGPEVVASAASAELAASMEEAVRLAADMAVAGDTVLLSPGCASFDMFENYGHRGDVFAAAVASLGGGA